MAGKGVSIWGQRLTAHREWLPIKVNASGVLLVDTTPGVKTVTEILVDALLAAGGTTLIGDCASIDLSGGPSQLAITVAATFNGAATLGLEVHVVTSYDNVNWDTQDFDMWRPDFAAGAAIQATKVYETDPMYMRVLIENLDPAQTITLIAVQSVSIYV